MTRLLTLGIVFALPAIGMAQSRPDQEAFFEAKIRPILAGTCFRCHGGDKVSGGLRVDSRAALLKGGESGPAIVPGDPGKSLIVKALRHQGDIKMPPKKKLPLHTVAAFSTWIKDGAYWPKTVKVDFGSDKKHWAFQPLKKRSVPEDPSGWSDNPIDRFISAKWQPLSLKPVRLADKQTLLRRVTFDLIGLPPTPEESATFLADSSPHAFAKVVERLLASPHYGERWGRHWMDVARYADTAGDNADYPIPEIYRYRDYIIDAFNNDKPFDQFVEEQLAGDILARQGPPEKYAERVVATGFLALSRRYATAPYELWHLTLEDTIDTVGQAFLGLTLRCARCHDHKFDPITNKDYYALYGIFASTKFPYTGSEELASMAMPRQHFVPLLPADKSGPLLKAHQKKINSLQGRLSKLESAPPQAEVDRIIKLLTKDFQEKPAQNEGIAILQKDILATLTAQRNEAIKKWHMAVNKVKGELKDLRRRGLPADLPGAYAVSEGTPADAYLQKRGDPEARGPVVPRGAPKFLAGERPIHIPAGQSGRLQLARWITQNPLTPRVMVNRIWQHHFGKGIVGTPNNFGMRGEEPTHPELLDYLASFFVEKKWSIKAMHRLIVLSKSYQLSSDEDSGNTVRDGANQWYWRFERRRLDAEAIRDALLVVSGTLDRSRPGPHPFPPIAAWGWTQHNPFKDVYPSNHRSVYLMTQRLQRHPFLALFDGPDTNTTTEKRGNSTVPLQALFWMNSPMMKDLAGTFAGRLRASAADDPARIRLAFRLAYGRSATKDEVERDISYLRRYAEELQKTGLPRNQAELEAWLSYARVLLCANEFVVVD
jgi:cytochrome c553